MKKKYDSIRIFKSDLWEATTHVHPFVPLVLWGPLVAYLFYLGVSNHSLSFMTVVFVSAFGLFVWTLSEYLLHRYVFHFPAKGPWAKRFVFLFHGLHHDDPNDPTRLVMPPVPAAIFIVLLYSFYSLFIPKEYMNIFFAFFLIGYLIYDYIHYATHHFKMKSRWARFLKKYHLQHHHAHEKSKYGVSSPLWDYIFKTVTGPKEDS